MTDDVGSKKLTQDGEYSGQFGEGIMEKSSMSAQFIYKRQIELYHHEGHSNR